MDGFEVGAVVTWADWYAIQMNLTESQWVADVVESQWVADVVESFYPHLRHLAVTVNWRPTQAYAGGTHSYNPRYLKLIEPVKGPW